MHKKIIYITSLVILLVGLLVLGLISYKEEASMGILVPATGRFANISEDVLHGLHLAIKNSVKHMIVEDTGGETQKTVTAWQSLTTQRKAKIVVSGPGGSSGNIAISSSVNKQRIPLIAISSTPTLRDQDDYVFMIHPPIQAEVKKMLEIFKTRGITKVAVVYDPASDTQTIAHNIFVKEFSNIGTITFSEGYGKDVDYRTLSTKIIASKPEAVYIIAVDKIAGPVVKQLREQKYTGLLTGFSVADSDEFLKSAGQHAENFIITALPFDCNRNKTTQNYCDDYVKTYNRRPTAFGAYIYDTMHFVQKVLDTCDSEIRSCLLVFDHSKENYLTEGFTLNKNGDMPEETPIYVKEVVGGVFERR